MKKFISISVLLLTTVLILSGCGTNHSDTPQEETATQTYSDETVNSYTNKNESEDIELPDSLFFMTNLDPVKNNNGTYSIYGFITSCRFSQYSNSPTIYITTLNGKEFSTGAAEDFRKLYIGNNGKTSVILNDLLENPANLRGIIFDFTYNTDGDLVDISKI